MIAKKIGFWTVLLVCCAMVQAQLTPWFESWDDGVNMAEWTYYADNSGYWALTTDVASPDPDQTLRYPLSNGKWSYRPIGAASQTFRVAFCYKGLAVGHESYDKNTLAIRNANGETMLTMAMNKSGDGVKVWAIGAGEVRYAAAEEWFCVKLLVDPAAMQCTWFFNEVRVEAFDLAGDAGIDVADLYLRHDDWSGDGVHHEGYIDAIEVSEFLYCGQAGDAYLAGDLTGPEGLPDCYVNLLDFAGFCDDWLTCTDPQGTGCTGWYFE